MTLPWKKHSDTHWSLPQLDLHYWPTRFKWRHENVTHFGADEFAVVRYIASLSEPREPPDRNRFQNDPSCWGYTHIACGTAIWVWGNSSDPLSRARTVEALKKALEYYS